MIATALAAADQLTFKLPDVGPFSTVTVPGAPGGSVARMSPVTAMTNVCTAVSIGSGVSPSSSPSRSSAL